MLQSERAYCPGRLNHTDMPFKVSGSLHLDESGRAIEEAFRDGDGLPTDGLEGFFPIIRMSETDRWNPLGTGFFISNNGLFATAKHVLTDDSTGALVDSLAGVQIIRRENRAIVRQVVKATLHPEFDVAVGFLLDRRFQEERVQTVNKFFSLTTSTPGIGAKVATFAFPRPIAAGNEDSFQLLFTSSGISGQVEDYYPKGRDSAMLRGPCFRTSMTTAGGASGAPVAFGDGHVFGLVSSGVPDQPVNYVSSIAPILELALPNLQLLSGEIRASMTISELADVGLVVLDPHNPSA